jgi:hypothetical protein
MEQMTNADVHRIGQNHALPIRLYSVCIFVLTGKVLVISGVLIQFWPTLGMHDQATSTVSI